MKKLLRNSALIGVFYYLLVMVNACCHCEPERTRFYTTERIVAQNVHFEILGDTAFSYSIVNKDSVARMNYGLQVQFDTKETVFSKFEFNGLMPSAFACKCGQGYFSPRDTLKSIRIFTLKDFDASHPAGSELSDYFKFLKQATSSGRISKMSISEAVNQLGTLSTSSYGSVQFYLDKMPDFGKANIQFEIIAEFSNSKILKDTSTIIRLY